MVGNDVSRIVLDFLDAREVPTTLNHTNIVLILKVPNPSKVSDFGAISLCNVVYKLAMKIITNRMKTILPRIISLTQSVFKLCRLIANNILASFEAFHLMQLQFCRNGLMAIKLDIGKAYDWVD